MYSYYIDRGHTLKELENLSYYEEQFYIASMYVNREQKVSDIIAGNPFLKKK